MRLLLDTHLVLWWEAGSPRLPGAVQLLVEEADVVFVSKVSLWEVAIKSSIGKLKLDVAAFATNIENHGFEWLDIKISHLVNVAALPLFDDHKDPFDRLLVAQSVSEPLQFLTVDARLDRFGETIRVF